MNTPNRQLDGGKLSENSTGTSSGVDLFDGLGLSIKLREAVDQTMGTGNNGLRRPPGLVAARLQAGKASLSETLNTPVQTAVAESAITPAPVNGSDQTVSVPPVPAVEDIANPNNHEAVPVQPTPVLVSQGAAVIDAPSGQMSLPTPPFGETPSIPGLSHEFNNEQSGAADQTEKLVALETDNAGSSSPIEMVAYGPDGQPIGGRPAEQALVQPKTAAAVSSPESVSSPLISNGTKGSITDGRGQTLVVPGSLEAATGSDAKAIGDGAMPKPVDQKELHRRAARRGASADSMADVQEALDRHRESTFNDYPADAGRRTSAPKLFGFVPFSWFTSRKDNQGGAKNPAATLEK